MNLARRREFINELSENMTNEDAKALIDHFADDGKFDRKKAEDLLGRGIQHFIKWLVKRDWPRVKAWREKNQARRAKRRAERADD